MGMTQAKPVERPQIEVGMIDERLNETVTYVAEMDVSAAQEDVRQLRRGLCPIICLLLPLSLGFPCVLLCMYCVYRAQRKHILSGVTQTQAYITDSTFVFVSPYLPIERARITVPLANIATVTTRVSLSI